MKHNIYIYMIIMAGVTYLIRVLPLTLIRKEIKSPFIRSFLYYVPYVTLAVMTFPAILSATGSPLSAAAAFIAAILLAWFGGSLFQVAVLACAVVFVAELFLLH
ncbi:MAG: AzlD domain-containing protein [Lachnospiraceae bacterium]